LSGAAIQMGIVIYLAVQGGKWLDAHYGTQKVFLPICTLLGVGISIYLVVQQLKKIKNRTLGACPLFFAPACSWALASFFSATSGFSRPMACTLTESNWQRATWSRS